MADEGQDSSPDPATPPTDVGASARRSVGRGRLVYWLVAVATLLLLGSFFGIEPLITVISGSQQRSLLPPGSGWATLLQHRLLEALTCLWFFLLGASLGSFVHCLEYRWPRGISVVGRGSACPGCGQAIRLWHNVPVFGWLYLRGRCVRCGWEIPARYALTELALGIMFVLLLTVELIGGGLNLPDSYASRFLGLTENIWDPNWRLIRVFAWHATLLTFLTTLSLFAGDRFGVSPLFAAITLAVAIIGPLVGPMVQVVKWDDLMSPANDSRLPVVVGQLAGGFSGLILGYCLVRRTPGNIRAGDVGATLLGMLLVGLFLGWQATLAIASLTVAWRVLFSLTAARSWPVVASMTAATLVHLLAWRWLIASPLYPLLHDRMVPLLTAVVAVPVLAAMVDSVERGGDAGPTIIDAPAFNLSAESVSVDVPAPSVAEDSVTLQ